MAVGFILFRQFYQVSVDRKVMIVGEQRFSVYTLEAGEVLLWDTVADYQRFSSHEKGNFGTLKGTGRFKVSVVSDSRLYKSPLLDCHTRRLF